MANQDQNLNYAWNVQKLGNTASQTGYAQPDTAAPSAAALSAALESTSGNGYSPAGTGAYGSNAVLTNPGYAGGNGTMLGVVTAPSVPASTVAIQNPYGNTAQVTLSGGTVTFINVAPNTASGAGTFTQVGTTTPAQVLVPPGGWIKVTYSVAPTWTWTTIN